MHSKDQKWLIALAGLTVLAAVALSAVFVRAYSDPSVPLLIRSEKARWILYSDPTDLVAKSPGDVVTSFRKVFTSDSAPKDAVLTVYAMKSAAVYIDGNPVNTPARGSLDGWKKPVSLNIGGLITPGEHELKIVVLNRNGPAALMAYCEPLRLFTGPEWQASRDEGAWKIAREADIPNPPAIAAQFPRSVAALASVLVYILPVFLAVFFWTLAGSREWAGSISRLTPSASSIRWAVVGAWVVLAVNNALKLRVDAGFDVVEHLQYISYVATSRRIPLPTEGWQMFQSPLYYIVSAPVYLLFKQLLAEDSLIRVLRIIPLLCGVIQVELTYRTLKSVYPGRGDIQALGTVIGGLLPMNIYISQYAGNEPMAGLFTSGALLVVFAILNRVEVPGRGTVALLGLLYGLALLSKVTPVLLAPPVLFALSYAASSKGAQRGRAFGLVGVFVLTALLVAGWYYARNWIEVGRPFVGGWDASRGIVWWQSPGYRTIGQFLTFGRSLAYPVYASYTGFWDAFYSSFWLDGYISGLNDFAWRPEWNYNFVISVALLSLLPSAAILTGAASTLFHPVRSLRNGELFALSCVAVYLAALLYLFLRVPIYSTVKATYTLGLIPCYAVLCASGFKIFLRHTIARAFVCGAVAAWAVSVYLAYFIL